MGNFHAERRATLAERCATHAAKADEAGMHTTGDVLSRAAAALLNWRTYTPAIIAEWCRSVFKAHADPVVERHRRVNRVLEEAVELAWAAGLTPHDIRRVVTICVNRCSEGQDAEFNKPELCPGEAADVAITLFALADTFGFNIDDAIDARHERNVGRGADYYARKTAEKAAQGL